MHLHRNSVLILAAGLAACGSNSPDFIECRDDTSCDRFADGQCIVNPATGNQFCAYPDENCPSGMQWSDLDVEESISGACVDEPEVDGGLVDGSLTDAVPPDGTPGSVEFDVGHVSEWRLGTSASNLSEYQWVRVVNTGDAPLDLSAAQITAVTDNHNQIVIDMDWQPVATVVQPGYSAGALTAAAAAQVVGNGLVTEPSQNTIDGLIHLTVTDLPAAGTWLVVQGEATLQIGQARATLSVTITSSGTGSAAVPNAGARVQSSPVP